MQLKNLARFRLSTILVMMLFCAIGFGAINWRLHWYREQSNLAEKIRAKSDYLEMQPGSPVWLKRFAHAGHFESIKAISYQNRTNVTDADLEILHGAPHLKVLSLHNTGVTDAGMEHVSKLKMLDTLSLKSTVVSDAGLAKLAGLTNLVKLQLSNTNISGTGLKHLAQMKHLQHLELVNIPITDDDFEHLAALPNLKVIYIQSDELASPDAAVLNSLKKLKELHIDAPKLKAVDLHDLPLLEFARFRGFHFENIRVKNCPALEGLYAEKLIFQNTPVLNQKAPVVHLEDLPKLERLSFGKASSLTAIRLSALTEVRFKDERLRKLVLEDLPSLKSLKATNTSFPPNAFQQFSVFPNLTDIQLDQIAFELSRYDYRPLVGSDLRPLNKHPNVQNLRISNHVLTSALDNIQHKKLKKLALVNCGILDADLAALTTLNQLESLFLSRNSLGGSGLQHMSLENLKTLNMESNPLTEEGVKQIGELTQLELLSLANTKIGARHLRHITQLYGLKVLSLRQNPGIDDQAFNHIICLPKLYIRGHDIVNTRVTIEKLRESYDRPAMMTQPTPLLTF